MRWLDYAFLFGISLVVALIIARLEPVPGYMDADYYYAGGTQIASGHGLTDPFIWNYLYKPQALPQPSNSYWYPLASMLAAAGMLLTGRIEFNSARILFILMAALAPLMIASLAYRITRKRQMAWLAGLLGVFCGYYLPFITTTENYSIFLVIGGIYFLLLDRLTWQKVLLLGFLAGLMNLARGDGILWLPLTILASVVFPLRASEGGSRKVRILQAIKFGILAVVGYLLVMTGWFIRNRIVFGTFLPPGSGSVLWMTSYNQLFSFTPQIYTFQSWLAAGLPAAIQSRLSALWQNLGTAFFAQGMIFLVPLILAGCWKERHSYCVQFALFCWLVMFLAESLLFPFASVNGGFFHAGAAFQPMWFALAPVGLEAILGGFSKRIPNINRIGRIFPILVLVIMIVFSALLVKIRVIDSGWNEGEYLYLQVDRLLANQGAGQESVVMARNPPAYFIMTGRQSIVVPYGDVQTLLAASMKYHANYVVLEEIGTKNPLSDLFLHPEKYPQFKLLGVIGDNRILAIRQ